MDPEDQYIDTSLRQSQIDPQLLLASARRTFGTTPGARESPQHQEHTGQQRLLAVDDTQENFQPMEGVDTMSTQHHTHLGHQRLLDDDDSHRDVQPIGRYDTAQTSRLLADDSVGRSFAPMHGLEATTVSDDGEVSADNSLAFLEETRQRFRQLEKEAEVWCL